MNQSRASSLHTGNSPTHMRMQARTTTHTHARTQAKPFVCITMMFLIPTCYIAEIVVWAIILCPIICFLIYTE